MHHRKKRSSPTSLENKQELKLTPATSRQLMKIRALEKEIKSLIEQINRPWSIALGALTIPFLAQVLLLNRYSPFHSYYTGVQQSIYDKYIQDIRSTRFRDLEQDVKPIAEQYTQMMTHDVAYARDRVANGNNLSPEEAVEQYTRKYPEQEKVFRFNLIGFYHAIWGTLYPKATVKSDGELSRMPIRELMKLASDTYEFLIVKGLPTIFSNAENYYATGNTTSAKIEADPWIIGFKLCAAIVVQTQFCNRIVPRAFPHGVFQNPAPRLPENQWISEWLAENHLENLINHRDALNLSAGFNVTIARIALVLFLPIIIAIYGAELPSALTIYFAISLASLALTNAKQEIQQGYAHCTFNSALKKQFKLLKTLEDENGIVEVKQYAGESLEQSHFILNFSSKGLGLSRGTLKNIIKHALIFNKINFLAETSDSFYLAANCVIDKTKLVRAKDLIDKNIKRQLAIQALKEQIIKLKDKKPDSITLYKPSHDADGLATAQIYFNLKPKEKFIFGKLSEISNGKLSFDANEGEDGYLYVRMSGHDSFDDEPFKEVQAFQSRVYEALKQQFMTTELESDTSEAKSSDKAEKELRRAIAAAKAAAKAAEVKSTTNPAQITAFPAVTSRPTPPLAPVRVITWPEGVFRSDDEKSPIHPIFINERVQTAGSVHRAHHFTLFGLQPSDFRNEVSYQKAKRLVEVPIIGNRNLVFAKGFKRKPNGEWITVSIKGRLKGENGDGDIGIYAQEVKSATGESLHVFEAMSNHRHTKRKS